MHDVRYDDEQDWLNVESVVGFGRPLWTTRFQDRSIVFLQKFARLKLLKRTKSESDNNSKPSLRQNMAVLLCRLGLFFSPVASISSSLVADHMATVYACDQKREAMLVSYYSEPILAYTGFWCNDAMEQKWTSSFTEIATNSINTGVSDGRDPGRDLGNDSAAEIHGRAGCRSGME
jgi:hypothetical protein